MKIAFVRGPHLNPWELQTYRGIAQKHEFTAIGADWQFYSGKTSLPSMSVTQTHLWGSAWRRWFPQGPVFYNRALSWSCGRSFGLDGLAEAVGTADVIHCAETYFTMSYQCAQLAQSRHIPLALTVWENLPHQGELHPLRRRRKAWVMQTTDAFLAVTSTTRAMLVSEGVSPEKIAVIPMAIDTARFRPQPRDVSLAGTLGIAPNDIVILFMGRLVEEKGIRTLLKAIAQVRRGLPNLPLKFLFVGAGPLEQAILAAQRRHPRHIVLSKFRPYDEIPLVHNLADVFVLPSQSAPKWQEQFGYVLVESMACAKAVITTHSGSIPDVVSDAALLIAERDPKALADRIIELCASPEKRADLGRRALHRARTVFSVEAVTPLLESFYDKLLRRIPVAS